MRQPMSGVYRSIYAAMLDDPDFKPLSSDSKLLLFALIVSRVSNHAGIFVCDEGTLLTIGGQISISQIAIREAIDSLSDTHWILYSDEIMWVRNLLRHSPHLKLSNPKHKTSVERIVEGLPPVEIVAKFCNYYELPIPDRIPEQYRSSIIDRVSNGYPMAIDRVSDNTNTITKDQKNTKKQKKEERPAEPDRRFKLWLKNNEPIWSGIIESLGYDSSQCLKKLMDLGEWLKIVPGMSKSDQKTRNSRGGTKADYSRWVRDIFKKDHHQLTEPTPHYNVEKIRNEFEFWLDDRPRFSEPMSAAEEKQHYADKRRDNNTGFSNVEDIIKNMDLPEPMGGK